MSKKEKADLPELTNENRTDVLALAIKRVNTESKFKNQRIKTADELLAQNPPLYSSGSIQMDIALGGGFKRGGVHTIYGAPSSAKTYTCLSTLAAAQECCADCAEYLPDCTCGSRRPPLAAYISTENDLDLAWMKAIGVDPRYVAIYEPSNGEAGLDAAIAFATTRRIDFIFIDSLAFLSAVVEVENSVASNHMGVRAKMLALAVRKLLATVNSVKSDGSAVTCFFTNHALTDLKVMFGSNEVKPGGKTPEYVALTETRLMPTKVERTKTGIPYGLVRYRVTKNKTGGLATAEGEHHIGFSEESPYKRGRVFEIKQVLDRMDVPEVRKEGSGNWAELGDLKYPNKENFVQDFLSNRKEWWKIRRELIKLYCDPFKRVTYTGRPETDGEESPL